MFVQLRFQPAPAAPEDAFQLLLDCHGRIRDFSQLALRLARDVESPPRERSEAARRLERYFTEALPRHVADEDLSLAPRLLRAGLSPRGLEALHEMSRQHVDIERLLARLLPTWNALATAPELGPELAAELRQDSMRLAALLESHLLLEEQALLPEARSLLSPEDARAVRAEMRARRAPKAEPRGDEGGR
ncbi:hemerythrin domain-containing protein [Pyxidicoccus sp. MSG2]|uniref:hemerythrin domain-containing protein n=1 Tax=Pyxidicoccus sp. MSG2 TaxID=2996790 RepID=UPI002271B00E|nr:hemerythrin domain-containing protein [Pyxidicoccus sp. MSG2]MCY1022769.1 hemerythrin domain-containing protein [Pyxidicoccus sp. MSG2]